ncbi:uncharacterized protein LOC135495369 [Lineus longissimus]|uniref:uncharacterized protein LOC135495369 n=1 Tax=Lineus longissimus TaxID=88925 RepID=UPI00315C8629
MDNQGMDPQQGVNNPAPQHVQPRYPVQHGYQAQQQQGGYPSPQPYGPQTGYGQPANTTAVVNQQPPPPDYGFPDGKAPSIILILVAIFNLLYLIIVGAVSGIWAESALMIIPLIVHGVVGGLGIMGSFTAPRSSACAICCIIAAVISMIVAFWQVWQLSVETSLVGNINRTWPAVIRIVVELGAFSCSLAMIIIPSKKVCCKQNPQSGGQVLYAQNTTAPA